MALLLAGTFCDRHHSNSATVGSSTIAPHSSNQAPWYVRALWVQVSKRTDYIRLFLNIAGRVCNWKRDCFSFIFFQLYDEWRFCLSNSGDHFHSLMIIDVTILIHWALLFSVSFFFFFFCFTAAAEPRTSTLANPSQQPNTRQPSPSPSSLSIAVIAVICVAVLVIILATVICAYRFKSRVTTCSLHDMRTRGEPSGDGFVISSSWDWIPQTVEWTSLCLSLFSFLLFCFFRFFFFFFVNF